MPALDSRLTSALLEQLGPRDAALRRGASRVGWKLGMGSLGDSIAIGYLTTETIVPAGEWRAPVSNGASLHVDAELCVELRPARERVRE